MTVGWSRVGSRAEEPCAKAEGRVCAPEQWSEQGAQLGQGHTQLGRDSGAGRGLRSWVVAPGSFPGLKARLHLQKLRAGRCGEWCGWYAETPHPLSLGRRTGLTSLFDSSGHSSFLSSFLLRGLESQSEVLTFMTRVGMTFY